jgi:tetratricopeptide (TPR) repeat protein
LSSRLYKAFISYSHADESWAAELHRLLETYKVPARLRGSKGLHGPIPEKLFPIFRDRDELSTGADLSEKVQEALRASDSMVLICSPAAAQSRWVNEEIRLFRSLGRGDRIYCVIVDGDPQAEDTQSACFPPAILETESGLRQEPLAADARKWADGKLLARLKLVSAILGIRLDELRQREQQRKRKFQILVSIASIAVVALVALTVVSKLTERNRQQYAEALVSQLVEVSADLDEVADLPTLRGIGERLARYLETLDQDDLSNESQLQVGLVLRQLGEVSRAQGRPDEAMTAFTRSREVLAKLAEDNSENIEAVFEFGQAEFWVGYIYADQGDSKNASKSFSRYLALSRQLFETEPENAEWAMEMAYALSNLGMIETRKVPVDRIKSLEFMQSSLEYNQLAVSLSPADDYYKSELAGSYANLADAWLEVCNLDGAYKARLNNVENATDFFQKSPGNNRLKMRYAFSLAGLATVQRWSGQQNEALDSLMRAVELLDELAREDQSNLTYRWNLHRKRARIAHIYKVEERLNDSWQLSLQVEQELRKLLKEDQSVSVVNLTSFGVFLTQISELAHAREEYLPATRLLNEGIAVLKDIVLDHQDNYEARFQLQQAIFRYWSLNRETLPEDEFLAELADYRTLESTFSCKDAGLAVNLSITQGDKKSAERYTTYLLGKGYYEPEFIQLCEKYDLCKDLVKQ